MRRETFMLVLDVRSNIAQRVRELTNLEKQFVPIATAKALTFTAETVIDVQRWKMTRVFSNPVRWTLNSLYLKPATVKDPMSAVYFKEWAAKGVPAGRYLYPQIHGGTRVTKSTERKLYPFMAGFKYAMPGAGAKLDASGNMKGSDLVRILSQVQALGGGSNMSPSTRKRNKRKGIDTHFIPKPGSGLKPGVYKRVGKGIIRVLVFTSTATYRPRYPFYELGLATAKAQFPQHFDRQLAREIRKAFSAVAKAA